MTDAVADRIAMAHAYARGSSLPEYAPDELDDWCLRVWDEGVMPLWRTFDDDFERDGLEELLKSRSL